MLKMIMHLTHECSSLAECEELYKKLKESVKDRPALHVNGQVTVKFIPSHPEGTPEKGPKP